MLCASAEVLWITKEFLSHANDLFILHQFCQFTYKEYSSLDDRRQRNSQWCGVVPISPSYLSECVSICVCVAQHLAAMGLSSIVSAQRRAGKVLLSRWPLHCCCTFECWGVTYLNRLRALHSQMGWAKPKMLFYGGFVQYQNRRNIERTRTPEF